MLTTFFVVVALCLIAAFWGGTLVRAPNDEAIDAAQTTVPVYVALEERVVGTQFRAPLSVVSATTAEVFVVEASQQASPVATTQTGSDRAHDPADSDASEISGEVGSKSAPAEQYVPEIEAAVVSAVTRPPGSVVSAGDVLGEVSNRPIIGVPADVPLFRNLVLGTYGEDVAGLQRMIINLGHVEVTESGRLDWVTLNAFAQLYDANGYQLPYVSDGVQGLSWRELLRLPAITNTVVATAAVGQSLSPTVAFMTFQQSAPTLKATVTAQEGADLAPGTRVGVQIGAAQAASVAVVGRGAVTANAETGIIGQDIHVSLPEGVSPDILSGKVVTLVALNEAKPTLAVPITAVRQENGQSFVLVEPNETHNSQSTRTSDSKKQCSSTTEDEEPKRVTIVPREQADGWLSIEENPELAAGTRVLVSS